MNKLISVITPAYNNESFLEDCLQSLLEQTYPHFEAIVIDDGSLDNTWELCEKLQKRDDRIHIFRQKHQGVSITRNRGMELASGNYFVFLDGDDMLHPDFLKCLLNRLLETKADMAGCNFFRIASTKVKKEPAKNFTENFDKPWKSLNPEQVQEWFYNKSNSTLGMASCKIITKSLICSGEQQKFAPTVSLGEDTLFIYQLIKKGVHFEFTDVKGYLYRMHNNSATHSWEPFNNKDPLSIYKKIRDEEFHLGHIEYAKKYEKLYLSVLRNKYNMAKRDGQKEICRKLCIEGHEAMSDPAFVGSRLIYYLTFHSRLLYIIGRFIWHCIKMLRGDKK